MKTCDSRCDITLAPQAILRWLISLFIRKINTEKHFAWKYECKKKVIPQTKCVAVAVARAKLKHGFHFLFQNIFYMFFS